MSLSGHNRNRIEADQMQVLSHPVRLGILALFTRDRSRSLAVADLREDLVAEDPDSFGEFDAAQVLYHRARLQDAQLLPTG
jgi:hypothetical protein